MKTLAPLLVLILLTGCATGPSKPIASSVPPAAGEATVSADAEGATTDFIGGEIHCLIQSIDGHTTNLSNTLKPGLHTVIAVLTSDGEEYVGVVQVGLSEARAYRLHAHRRKDSITVTLVDDENRLVATSTASLAAQMKFSVFVKQM